MSNIDKQWLQQTIADMEEHRDLFPGDLDDNHENVLAALRIALASLEAEAAYFINRVKHSDAYGEDVELRTYCYELDALKSKDDFGGEIVPVYTAPPAPVSVPDEVTSEDCPAFVKYEITEVDEAWARGFNACRAAMLQGAENGESPTTMQTAPALDSSPKIAESPSGNSPVIPDGWVMVPVDMTPGMMRAVQINSELGAYAAANLSGAYSLFREFWDVAIAATLQQEVRP